MATLAKIGEPAEGAIAELAIFRPGDDHNPRLRPIGKPTLVQAFGGPLGASVNRAHYHGLRKSNSLAMSFAQPISYVEPYNSKALLSLGW